MAVGFTDHDVVLALGVVPVGLRDRYGDHGHGVWPWGEGPLGGAAPELLVAEELNFARIAALEPDLILGLYGGLERGEYETLARIAPTVARSGEHAAFGTPRRDMTRVAGRALGRSGEAEALIAGVERRFRRGPGGAPGVRGRRARPVGAGRPGPAPRLSRTTPCTEAWTSPATGARCS